MTTLLRIDSSPFDGATSFSRQLTTEFVEQWRETHPGGKVIGRDLITTKRSEEHTSELQSHCNLVCGLLLEKNKKRSNVAKFACRSTHHSEQRLTRTRV